ncbi:gliding motility-associated peptidyl-prolyl isomerase GldI [Flavobacterium sp. K77]|uniref:gliding motility-associated peptidyl-prolyl isomerase GldI n=1 Tax=Flavobacterium sp. K77 TaxID=2910676 RepID=UPI001F1DEC8A|nr:gliding motility-associated peptidyl-prolyl isomerase GldI [Flavobacterium sp. K77]MCF6141613.1 gliding motility-associated peptidyl-prolyl isomerase GldI [Flavobacterium sp. K77]
MKNSKHIALVIIMLLLISSCKQSQDARRPISHSSGSFMKKSILRNKKLVATEELQIQNVIKNNPNIVYLASKKGYWYSYEARNTTDTLTPIKGDVALFDYEIKDLAGTVIYSQSELAPQTYYVDKQNIMMGLRDGIKLMRKNEKVNFLFPSNMAYGYRGDSKKIGTNQPIICTVVLRDFLTESKYKLMLSSPTTGSNDSLITTKKTKKIKVGAKLATDSLN